MRKFISKFFPLKFKFNSYGYFLLLIFSVGFLLRVLGVNPGFPNLSPDEPTIKDSAIRIALNLDFKPVAYYYGQLLPILYALGYDFFFLPLYFIFFLLTNVSQYVDRGFLTVMKGFIDYNLAISDPLHLFHYWGRYQTAIISSMTVIPLYFIGKKLFNRKVGLIAAFLMAVNYRHVLSSSVVLADAPASFFATLSVLFSVNLMKDKSKKAYLLAGTAMALSLSVKYFIYIVPVFFICHILSQKKIKKIIFNKNFFLALLSCAFIFLAINPHLILDHKTAQFEFFLNASRYGFYSYNPTFFDLTRGDVSLIPIYYLFWRGITPLVSIFIVIGFLYGLIRFTKGTLLVSAVTLPFLFMFSCVFGDPPSRNFSAIMPFLMIYPSILIVGIGNKIKNKKLSMLVIISISLIIAFPSLVRSFFTTIYYMKPHNQPEFIKWAEKNIPNKATVAVSAVSLPGNKELNEININPLGGTHILSLHELKKSKIEWVAVSSYYTQIQNYLEWFGKHMVGKTFFNQDLFWNHIENNYISLILQELNDYKIKEFLKPFEYSTDRAIFVVNVPKWWEEKKDNLIKSYKFEDEKNKDKIAISEGWQNDSYALSFSTNSYQLGGMILKAKSCKSGTQISFEKIQTEKNKWHTLTGFAKRKAPLFYSPYVDGFFRLDFYSKDDKRIKTYVSQILDGLDSWQELVLAGLSPKDAEYLRIGFQLDTCYSAEQVVEIDEIELYSSDSNIIIDNKKYPYYGEKLPRNFLWPLEY